MKHSLYWIAILGLLTALISGCATTAKTPKEALIQTLAGKPVNGKSEAIEAAQSDAFVQQSLKGFHTFTLSNGIPVIVKQNTANQVFHVRLILDAPAGFATQAKAGLELFALRLMARGSLDHPYDTLAKELDATSSGFSADSAFDFSSYSLNTLDKYTDKVLPIWLETLAQPGFELGQVEKVRFSMQKAIESEAQDPWQTLATQMNAKFFANHPYGIRPQGTDASLKAITVSDVRAWYQSAFVPERMFVIAVGNVDEKVLREGLEKALGTLKANPAVKLAPSPALGGAVKQDLFSLPFASAKGITYLRGDFATPAPADPDFFAFNIGAKILSDLLFEVIRTRNSAAYTPGSYNRAFSANYGSITIYKTDAPEKIQPLVKQALDALLSGKSLAAGAGASTAHGDPAAQEDPKSPLPLVDLAQSLDDYKAQYINGTYESLQTNAEIAGLIANSVIHLGDYRAYLLDASKIQKVQPAELVASIKKWIADAPILWGMVGDKTLMDKVNPEDYKK